MQCDMIFLQTFCFITTVIWRNSGLKEERQKMDVLIEPKMDVEA